MILLNVSDINPPYSTQQCPSLLGQFLWKLSQLTCRSAPCERESIYFSHARARLARCELAIVDSAPGTRGRDRRPQFTPHLRSRLLWMSRCRCHRLCITKTQSDKAYPSHTDHCWWSLRNALSIRVNVSLVQIPTVCSLSVGRTKTVTVRHNT